MKTNGKIQAGDTLFIVDPQKLVITRASVVEVSKGYGSISREHRSSLHEKVKALIKIALDKFPSEHNGIFYFTKDSKWIALYLFDCFLFINDVLVYSHSIYYLFVVTNDFISS